MQECPNIIFFLKYFCQDYRQIPVIAAGFMVRIKLQREMRRRGPKDNDKNLFPVGKIDQSFGLKEHITLPLMPDNTWLFLGDIGIFSYQSGINADSFISSERENIMSGIFFEIFVADDLAGGTMRI